MSEETSETPTPEPAGEAAPAPAAVPESAASALDIGSQAAAETPRVPATLRGRVEPDGTAIGTGRRKTAVARVRVRKGTGKIVVNDRPYENYFSVERHRLHIEAPLKATGVFGQVDVWVRATGG